jgi:3-isopropylmalate/(R)-2-methylmalate dehydratase large subunit
MTGRTLYDKLWDDHVIHTEDDGTAILYIDRHLLHEVTSPQAFDGLRLAGRPVRRPDRTLATADHNVPTDGTPVAARIKDALSRTQVETLERNCAEFGIPIYSLGSDRQGIVHVIGPELGVTQPGMTIVCGDSHTATHGAFGALAFGIGTSEVEHVLATQTLAQRKPRSMVIRYEGELGFGVTAKDLILGTIGQMGTNGAAGHVVEFAGEVIRAMNMEQRMTVCNMTIEGGGRAGMIAPDETTFEWVRGRPGAPEDFEEALTYWRTLQTELATQFQTSIDAGAGAPPNATLFPTTAALGPTTSIPEPASLVGQEVPTFNLGLSANGTVIAVDATPVRAIAETRLLQRVGADHQLVAGSTDIQVGDGVVGADGVVRFTATARAKRVLIVDADSLRSLVKGRSAAEARTAQSPYGDATVELWPSWVSTVTGFDARLTVRVVSAAGSVEPGGSPAASPAGSRSLGSPSNRSSAAPASSAGGSPASAAAP